MADPLSFLRKYNVSKKVITERNNRVVFGEYSWPKTVKTNYLVWGSSQERNQKDYYSLECLLYLLKNLQLSHPAYVRQAAAESIPFVRRPDRKNLLRYLNGDVTTSSSIDKSAPIEIPTTVKHAYEDKNRQEIVKKPKLEQSEVQSAKDQLAAELASPKEASVTTEHIRSRSDVMSVKVVETIKSKRLVKKRSTINIDDEVPQTNTEIGRIHDYDVDVTRNIISRKQRWTLRTTILHRTQKILESRNTECVAGPATFDNPSVSQNVKTLDTPVTGTKASRVCCKKRKVTNIEKRINVTYDFSETISSKPKVDKDESHLFGELLCCKLRKLDDDTRQIAMHEINNLMSNF